MYQLFPNPCYSIVIDVFLIERDALDQSNAMELSSSEGNQADIISRIILLMSAKLAFFFFVNIRLKFQSNLFYQQYYTIYYRIPTNDDCTIWYIVVPDIWHSIWSKRQSVFLSNLHIIMNVNVAGADTIVGEYLICECSEE
jgi:hypothetical protein